MHFAHQTLTKQPAAQQWAARERLLEEQALLIKRYIKYVCI